MDHRPCNVPPPSLFMLGLLIKCASRWVREDGRNAAILEHIWLTWRVRWVDQWLLIDNRTCFLQGSTCVTGEFRKKIWRYEEENMPPAQAGLDLTLTVGFYVNFNEVVNLWPPIYIYMLTPIWHVYELHLLQTGLKRMIFSLQRGTVWFHRWLLKL